MGLPRWGGAAHLRRDLQTRSISARAGAATSRPRCTLPMATRAPLARWGGAGPSGPGVTNAVTGIATAYMDNIPMVIITGQVPTAAIGLDAFQECDTVGITRPIVKHNFLIKDARDIAETMKRRFILPAPGALVRWWSMCPKTSRSTACLTPATPPRWLCARTTRCAKVTPAKFAVPRSCCCGQAAVHLHRRRCHTRRGGGRAARTCRLAQLPRNQHAHGAGGVCCHRPTFSWHAGYAWHH